METIEPVAVAAGHTTASEECPFCPKKEPEPFVTYPGAAALGTTLGAIMDDPSQLESDARPKDGKPDRQQGSVARKVPAPPLQHPVFGAYSYEAHHLIPGQQKLLNSEEKVMDGHVIEEWLCAGGKVQKDTGYSINNCDNGVWLPSAPESVKKLRGRSPARPWEREGKKNPHPARLTDSEKEEIAFYAMDNGAGQFHYGKHGIEDETGAHSSYPEVVATRLKLLADRFLDWSQACLVDGKNPPQPPFRPTHKINAAVDRVSERIHAEIKKMPPSTWYYFISSYAMRRHQRECAHGDEEVSL